MIKKHFFTTLLLLCGSIACNYAGGTNAPAGNKKLKTHDKLEKSLLNLPDSVFGEVKAEDLLEDEVYVKLARDGWTSTEITTIMGTALKDRKTAKNKFGYGQYAKQWLPSFGYTPGGDTIYQFVDTTYNAEMWKSVHRTIPDKAINAYWEKQVYSPEDRKQGIRRPAYFRTVEHHPSSGRMHWAQLHPEDPDKLMVIADGTGIFKTDDGGKTWSNMTDRIPLREHRNTAQHSAIPVDPDDWNHVFAFMNNSTVYETTDGGQSWRRIEGATHKNFKRGHAFRDKAGRLKFIGAQQQGGISHWASKLWISEDTCRTWTEVIVPEELKDQHPEANGKGVWFQQIEFDPSDRDKIYLPGSRSIFYFDDGAQSTLVNGKPTYNIKKMEFEVYNEDRTERRRAEDYPDDPTLFPLKGTSPGHMAINPNNPDQMWFAGAIRSSAKSALYYTEDKGKTWITLHEPVSGIGSGLLFGNEAPWNWLGGFGVNFKDPNWVYGCSMSSAISSDGGRNFQQFGWATRLKSQQADGNYYPVTNSRHNADNHFILSHKSGRVFRGSDGGMLVKDPEIQNNEWTNIGSNMGQMLYYSIRVNEFGDQTMIGNTQDIDVQTYRYGRWGNWRGYEGSEASLNPYTNTGYFSGGGGGGIENMPLDSWSTTRNFADVHTGSWYSIRTGVGQGKTFFRVDDIGRSMVNLFENVGDDVADFTLARDKGHTTIFVRTASNIFKVSTDGGNTFQDILVNGAPAKFSGAQLASDPDNSDILYFGQKGKVHRLYVNEGRWEQVGNGLPDVNCDELLFHEGSGDLYFSHKGSGIYILENGSDTWRFWTKGYNPGKFNDVVINYTTQEMVLQDYGRGIWVADLEHPADRFFKDGFALTELSHVDGRRTIGIDTRWTIPLYYHYEWTVNGVKADHPYQYLTAPLQTGDKVQLKLTLRESPDVSTVSDEYTVRETPSETLVREAGRALYSTGAGRVDLGYVDYFYKDFSIDFWVRPAGNGVLLANRQKSHDKGAKGFIIFVEDGQLKFRYSPSNQFNKPTYEPASDEQKTITGGAIALNEWSHVAVTESREGNIRIYINGIKTAEEARYCREHSLNNSTYLSLFADAFEYDAIEAGIDELKIWNTELAEDEVRREMYAVNTGNRNGLVVYYNFNGDSLKNDTEAFARYQPRVMTRAVVRAERMTAPVGAQKSAYALLSGEAQVFEDNGTKLLKIQTNGETPAIALSAYTYNASQWLEGKSNLDPKYYEVEHTGYLFHAFDKLESDTFAISFFASGRDFRADKNYRLYYADGDSDYWLSFGTLQYEAETGALRATQVPASELAGKRLVIVSLKPAIELHVEGLSPAGRLELYTEDKDLFDLRATLVERLPEPAGAYEIESDNDILQPQGELYFTKGEAHATIKADYRLFDSFNQTISTRLSGKGDDRMISTPVEVVNRITPKELGESVLITQGGLTVGEASDFQELHLSNTVTLMGWVRIDDPGVLSGTKPLLFFRSGNPSTATGLHLENGNVRCHWNEESWSWNSGTSLKVTADDLGRWIHLALVVRPDGVDYYLNGMKHTNKRTVSKGRIHSMFMLGQNQVGNKWFTGAFDQVGVWNRSLSQEEVIRYMHERVLLTDSALVAYLNMDYMDGELRLRELKNDLPTKEYGTVTKNYRSVVPFNPLSSAKGDNETLSLTFPAGKSVAYHVNTYEGEPYNYFNPSRQTALPLNREFYTVAYETLPAFTAEDTLSVQYRHAGILAGDSLILAVRPLGSEQAFDTYVAQKTLENGLARFTVGAGMLKQAVEIIFFVSPESGKRPAKVEFVSAPAVGQGADYMLADQDTVVPFKLKIVSGQADDEVRLHVKESAYASLDKDEVDMRKGENSFAIRIDKDKLDKMGLNPVTVNVVGAESRSLELNVYLEPKVRLSLKNGTGEHTFTATSPTATLEVEAELLQGYLDKEVELATVADVNSAMNIANGALLLNQNVTIGGLEHYDSPHGDTQEGWNLIGNPYLANINLTKHQNVDFDKRKVTKFIYYYDRALDNYLTADMTDYDGEQKILPFQSYFVQTMDPNAELTITPIAKSTAVNRRTLDHYTASEHKAVRLTLHTAGKRSDRTDISWEDGASPLFVTNEDAPKLERMNLASNQLYSLAGSTEASVNSLPKHVEEIGLGLRIGTPGEMVLSLDRMSGFSDKEWLILFDSYTGAEWYLTPGNDYHFHAYDEGEYTDRFILQVKRQSVTVGMDENEATVYDIYVSNGTCTIDGLRGDASISIFDMQGQLVTRDTSRHARYSVALNKGGYVVKIRENGKDYVAKIIVK